MPRRAATLSLAASVIIILTCFAAPALDSPEDMDMTWSSRSMLAARRSAVLSSEVGYKIAKIHREMGQIFEQGDPLVEFDDRLSKARLDYARDSLAAAEANLAAVTGMFERHNASTVELETARRDRSDARARLEEARLELEACTIRAPFPGRMVELHVNEHEAPGRGAKVATVADDSRLLAQFLFPEDKFGGVALGDVLAIAVPLAGVTVPAIVSHIAAGLDPASRTFDVWAEIDNRDGTLRPGMTAMLAPAEDTAP